MKKKVLSLLTSLVMTMSVLTSVIVPMSISAYSAAEGGTLAEVLDMYSDPTLAIEPKAGGLGQTTVAAEPGDTITLGVYLYSFPLTMSSDVVVVVDDGLEIGVASDETDPGKAKCYAFTRGAEYKQISGPGYFKASDSSGYTSSKQGMKFYFAQNSSDEKAPFETIPTSAYESDPSKFKGYYLFHFDVTVPEDAADGNYDVSFDEILTTPKNETYGAINPDLVPMTIVVGEGGDPPIVDPPVGNDDLSFAFEDVTVDASEGSNGYVVAKVPVKVTGDPGELVGGVWAFDLADGVYPISALPDGYDIENLPDSTGLESAGFTLGEGSFVSDEAIRGSGDRQTSSATYRATLAGPEDSAPSALDDGETFVYVNFAVPAEAGEYEVGFYGNAPEGLNYMDQADGTSIAFEGGSAIITVEGEGGELLPDGFHLNIDEVEYNIDEAVDGVVYASVPIRVKDMPSNILSFFLAIEIPSVDGEESDLVTFDTEREPEGYGEEQIVYTWYTEADYKLGSGTKLSDGAIIGEDESDDETGGTNQISTKPVYRTLISGVAGAPALADGEVLIELNFAVDVSSLDETTTFDIKFYPNPNESNGLNIAQYDETEDKRSFFVSHADGSITINFGDEDETSKTTKRTTRTTKNTQPTEDLPEGFHLNIDDVEYDIEDAVDGVVYASVPIRVKDMPSNILSFFLAIEIPSVDGEESDLVTFDTEREPEGYGEDQIVYTWYTEADYKLGSGTKLSDGAIEGEDESNDETGGTNQISQYPVYRALISGVADAPALDDDEVLIELNFAVDVSSLDETTTFDLKFYPNEEQVNGLNIAQYDETQDKKTFFISHADGSITINVDGGTQPTETEDGDTSDTTSRTSRTTRTRPTSETDPIPGFHLDIDEVEYSIEDANDQGFIYATVPIRVKDMPSNILSFFLALEEPKLNGEKTDLVQFDLFREPEGYGEEQIVYTWYTEADYKLGSGTKLSDGPIEGEDESNDKIGGTNQISQYPVYRALISGIADAPALDDGDAIINLQFEIDTWDLTETTTFDLEFYPNEEQVNGLNIAQYDETKDKVTFPLELANGSITINFPEDDESDTTERTSRTTRTRPTSETTERTTESLPDGFVVDIDEVEYDIKDAVDGVVYAKVPIKVKDMPSNILSFFLAIEIPKLNGEDTDLVKFDTEREPEGFGEEQIVYTWYTDADYKLGSGTKLSDGPIEGEDESNDEIGGTNQISQYPVYRILVSGVDDAPALADGEAIINLQFAVDVSTLTETTTFDLEFYPNEEQVDGLNIAQYDPSKDKVTFALETSNGSITINVDGTEPPTDTTPTETVPTTDSTPAPTDTTPSETVPTTDTTPAPTTPTETVPTSDTTVPTSDTTVPTSDTTVPTSDTTVPTSETTVDTSATTEDTTPTEEPLPDDFVAHWGDVNVDGSTNITDIVVLFRYIAGNYDRNVFGATDGAGGRLPGSRAAGTYNANVFWESGEQGFAEANNPTGSVGKPATINVTDIVVITNMILGVYGGIGTDPADEDVVQQKFPVNPETIDAAKV
jgi:hypothetical protein